MGVYDTVLEALDNSVDNGYLIDERLSDREIAEDIAEKTGFLDPENDQHMEDAIDAIQTWRYEQHVHIRQ